MEARVFAQAVSIEHAANNATGRKSRTDLCRVMGPCDARNVVLLLAETVFRMTETDKSN